jgi:hypothetical protein
VIGDLRVADAEGSGNLVTFSSNRSLNPFHGASGTYYETVNANSRSKGRRRSLRQRVDAPTSRATARHHYRLRERVQARDHHQP